MVETNTEHLQPPLEQLKADSALGVAYHDLLALTTDTILQTLPHSSDETDLSMMFDQQAKSYLKDHTFTEKKYLRLGLMKLKQAFGRAQASVDTFLEEKKATTPEKTRTVLLQKLLEILDGGDPSRAMMVAAPLLKQAEIQSMLPGMYVVKLPASSIHQIMRSAGAFYASAPLDSAEHSRIGFLVVPNDEGMESDSLKALSKHELHHLFWLILQSPATQMIAPISQEKLEDDVLAIEAEHTSQTVENNPFRKNYRKQETFNNLQQSFDNFRNEVVAYMLNQEDGLFGIISFTQLDLSINDNTRIFKSLLPVNFERHTRIAKEIKWLALEAVRSIQNYLLTIESLKKQPGYEDISALSILKEVMSSQSFTDLINRLDKRNSQLQQLLGNSTQT